LWIEHMNSGRKVSDEGQNAELRVLLAAFKMHTGRV